MILNMADELETERPLGDLLPLRVKVLIQRNGVHTVDDVRKAYPHQLLKMWGMGMVRFKQIEAAFFPAQSFTPKRVYAPLPHIKGSSLKGTPLPRRRPSLGARGITTVDQLLAAERKDLMNIKGLGALKLREIEKALHQRMD